MPPPVISVVETGSTLNLPLNDEYVVVEEQPRGRLGFREVGTAPDDEEWWCLEDKIGCDTVKCFCFKWSFSIKWICCDNQEHIDAIKALAGNIEQQAADISQITQDLNSTDPGLIDPPQVHRANIRKKFEKEPPNSIDSGSNSLAVQFSDIRNSLS